MEQFGKGYYICTGSDTSSQLYLAAGVNNYESNVTNAHGSAWATMTTTINSWITSNNYASQVKIRAAADIEPDFGSATNAIAWVNGYNSNHGSGLWLYNVGAASGCPYTDTPTSSSLCNNNWTVDNVLYVSWGQVPFFVIPEIYNTASMNAEQWYLISLYSALYQGEKIVIQVLLPNIKPANKWVVAQELIIHYHKDGLSYSMLSGQTLELLYQAFAGLMILCGDREEMHRCNYILVKCYSL